MTGLTCRCGQWPLEEYGAKCPSCPDVLTYDEWDDLVYEESLLGYGHGLFAYTDVTPREGSEWITQLWEVAADYLSNNVGPDEGDQVAFRHAVARRVALAQAVLVFGPDFVGLPERA